MKSPLTILTIILVVIILIFAVSFLFPSYNEIKIGVILSFTGDLASYGSPLYDAASLAVNDINNAGGVLGAKVVLVPIDDTSTPEGAKEAMKKMKDQNIQIVIGPLGSGMALSALEVAKQYNILMISPSATSPALTKADDKNLFFRTVASDALQGKAMAKLATDKGFKSASTLVIDNAYGTGIEEVFTQEFTKLGGKVISNVRYSSDSSDFTKEIDEISKGNPDVIVLVGYPESGAKILKTAYEKGVLNKFYWIFSEGLAVPELANSVGKDSSGRFIVAGMGGTQPDPRAIGPSYNDFATQYKSVYKRDPIVFAGNTYDAVVVAALATQKAGRYDGAAIAKAIPSVTNPPGDKVTDIATALGAIKAGKKINYEGASSDLTFDENGDVYGEYCEWTIGEDGNIKLGSSIKIT